MTSLSNRAMQSSGSKGFTVVELVVSTGIIVAVMGVALVVVGQARDALDRDGIGVEAAQRLRAGLNVLERDIRAAGAGPEADAAGIALGHSLPVVEPLRLGGLPASDDAFSALRVLTAPAGAAHGRLAAPAAPGQPLSLSPPPACPALPACGFRAGVAVAIYDGSGAFDLAAVDQVDAGSWSVVVEPPISRPYEAGAVVSEIAIATFGVQADPDGTGRLLRRTGGGAVQPIVDHVVSFSVDAFGDAAPPWPGRGPESPPTYGPIPPAPEADDPRDPWAAGENCTIARGPDGVSVARLPLLGDAGASIVLGPTQLRDGPWCPGAAGAAYDADLFRLRRVDLRLRVEAASARVRGPAGPLFSRGGHGRAATWVPDLELRVSLSPPNMGRR